MSIQNCPICGSFLFAAIPFQTTHQEIVDFAQNSALLDKEAVIQSRSIHPGVYCRNGCYRELWDYGSNLLPEINLDMALAIVKAYSLKYLVEFTETHGQTSRFLACVHCKKFDGASVKGQPQTSFYRNPSLKPLRDKEIVSARCVDPRIQALNTTWWYDQGHGQPDCPYFEYNSLFRFIFKRMTDWTEYPGP